MENSTQLVLAEAKLPFMKRSYPLEEAMELFRSEGMEDKVRLFHYRMSSAVNIYEIDGYYDYYYGYMLPKARNPFGGEMICVYILQSLSARSIPGLSAF